MYSRSSESLAYHFVKRDRSICKGNRSEDHTDGIVPDRGLC